MAETLPSKNQKNWPIWVIFTIIVIISIAIGALGHSLLQRYFGDFGLVHQAHDIILENALNQVSEESQVEYGMIRGMLETLKDPYAVFVEPDDHELQTDQLQGNYGGIGVQVQKDTDNNWRIYPIPDSAAEAVGLQDGDILLQVDDLEITSDLNESTILAAIRGPIKTKIRITVQRDEDVISTRIRRDVIAIPSVTWHLIPEAPQIVMITLNRFAEMSAEEIKSAIEASQQEGVRKFILDLRNNGGGLVKTGLEISELFLEDGVIIHRLDKGNKSSIEEVHQPGIFKDIPLVIFINENTASSAEIVAGAIKAHQRALLIGQSSFGKTSIQYVFDLHDGSSIHLTSGTWWIPGVDFPLEPDIQIDENSEDSEWIQTAIDILSSE